MLAFSLFGKAMITLIEIEKEVFNMLAGLIVPKQCNYRNIINTIIACTLIIGLASYFNKLEIPSKAAALASQTTVPLLLNSGVVMTKEAEVSVILWFENGEIPPEIWTKRPAPDWTWTYKESQTASGKVAVTLSGHRYMDKNEESNLYTWYTIMVRQLAQTGGRIYLDERVPQATDISAYLSEINALPAQWYLSGSLVSIAAYQKDLPTNVMAGNDRVNIQLLSRGKHNEGQTVLAIPALLEEF